jgi:DNA-binding response OmpR family regulator
MNSFTHSPPTALVVDDNELTLEVLQYALEDAGFETTAVTHGSLALTMLAKQCFDVLVVDVNLPRINGIALAEQARERYEDRIAILVTSDQDIERWRVVSLQVCADDFLGKPFDLDEFIARIESKVRRLRKPRREQEATPGPMTRGLSSMTGEVFRGRSATDTPGVHPGR